MKIRALGILGLSMCMCFASVAEAQRGGGGGQRGGAGGAGGQRGGAGGQRGGPGGQRGGPQGVTQLLGLLRMEVVRKDIGMDDETSEAITEAVREAMPDRTKMRDASEEERAEMTKKGETAVKDVLDEVLTPKQFERLLGLLVQQTGYSAAANTLIAEKIGLKEDGIKKVGEALSDARRSMFEKMRGGGQRGEGGQGGRPDFAAIMKQMREAGDEAIAKVLSKEQTKQLDDMKGAEIEFPAPQFGGRGGAGGGQGGRGGAGGGQGGRGGAGGGQGGRAGGGQGGRGGAGGRGRGGAGGDDDN